ncbi:hypothetical protein [Shimia biformata]|uniref:hypothetical protein n=1 Tax=Shimia biformata TaxID=1294299 RepID=UPI001951B3DC|nr:hypothetical protein [Shimia biformata]
MPEIAPETLEHVNYGRNKRSIIATAAALAFLAFLYSVGTSPWILGFLSLFVLPALIDVLLNPVSTLTMDATDLRWKSVLQEGRVPLSEIALVRMDTRWDVSVRVTLTLTDGKKLRLPHDVTPNNKLLEQALAARGIKTERHHFRVI